MINLKTAKALGLTIPKSAQQFSDYLKTEVAKWGRIVRESGIKAN